VVAGEPEQFQPRRDGDRLYARGAQDMKVSALVLAQVFRARAPTLPYPIALQLVADEEVGGRDGTPYQIQQGVTGTFVVVGEHSGLNIVADSKALLHARLLANGHSGHGAYPSLGDNALLKLVNTVTGLLARYPVATEEDWRTTVNLARMDPPNRAFNQVPAQAEAWLDIRFPADDADLNGRTRQEVTEICIPSASPVSRSPSTTSTRRTTPTMTESRSPSCGGLRRVRATQAASSISTVPATGGSTPDGASPPSPSVSAAQDSTARTSMSRSPPSCRTTRR
jgi:succinyl-diaminopimelate desuccinylase